MGASQRTRLPTGEWVDPAVKAGPFLAMKQYIYIYIDIFRKYKLRQRKLSFVCGAPKLEMLVAVPFLAGGRTGHGFPWIHICWDLKTQSHVEQEGFYVEQESKEGMLSEY